MKLAGAKSPYPGDPNRYVWDWGSDVYRVAATGVAPPARAIPFAHAAQLIDTYSLVTNDEDSLTEEPDAECYVQSLLNSPPLVVFIDGVCWLPRAWSTIDWEADEYCFHRHIQH